MSPIKRIIIKFVEVQKWLAEIWLQAHEENCTIKLNLVFQKAHFKLLWTWRTCEILIQFRSQKSKNKFQWKMFAKYGFSIANCYLQFNGNLNRSHIVLYIKTLHTKHDFCHRDNNEEIFLAIDAHHECARKHSNTAITTDNADQSVPSYDLSYTICVVKNDWNSFKDLIDWAVSNIMLESFYNILERERERRKSSNLILSSCYQHVLLLV